MAVYRYRIFNNGVLLFCFVVAICCKLFLQFHFFKFDGDKALQAVAAKSLYEGHGLSVPVAQGSGLFVYKPLRAWPPGYSLLLLPFYGLTHSLPESTLLADAVATVCFFIFYFLLLKKLQFSVSLSCLLLCFNGVAVSQDIVYSAPTDLVSLAAILALLYYFILLIERNRYNLLTGIGFGLLCVLPVFFRYLYLPVAFVLPPVLCWLGWVNKNNAQLKTGFIALIGVTFFCVALLFFSKNPAAITGNNPSLTMAAQFNPAPIQYTAPFLLSAFSNPDFVLQQLSRLTGYTYQTLNYALVRVHLFALFIFFVFLIWFTKKSKPFEKQTSPQLFFSTGLIACFFTIIILFLLSATTPLIAMPQTASTWTYVQEERYFKFVVVFLPLFAFYYLRNGAGTLQQIKRFLCYTLLFLIAAETLHGFYFIGRRVVPQLSEKTILKSDR